MADISRPKTQASNRKQTGLYRRLIGDNQEKNECIDEDILVVAEDNVYEVERLIEVKVVKVSYPPVGPSGEQLCRKSFYFGHLFQSITHYLVLWKNYSKEDASWVPASEITESAIRSVRPAACCMFVFQTCSCLLYFIFMQVLSCSSATT